MIKLIGTAVMLLLLQNTGGCEDTVQQNQPKAASGVQQQSAKVQVGGDGLTVEQRNVRDRLAMDNKPGSIKHLYVISAYSGQVILYSTVKGKVTSSGKRLTPTQVSSQDGQYVGNEHAGTHVWIGDRWYYSPEVLQDDGTYGSSVEYLYWWDVQGRYHQQYVTGGMILHISDQPIPVKSITINIDASN